VSPVVAPVLSPVSAETMGLVVPPVVVSTSGPAPEPTPPDLKSKIVSLLDEFSTFSFSPIDRTGVNGSLESISHAVLAQEKGLCGEQSIAFMHVLGEDNITTRYVAVWGISGFGVSCYASHALVEAWYDDAWHLFDPTFSLYFIDIDGHVLSMDELLAKKFSNPACIGDAAKGSELLGYVQSHFAITYGWEELYTLTSFMKRGGYNY